MHLQEEEERARRKIKFLRNIRIKILFLLGCPPRLLHFCTSDGFVRQSRQQYYLPNFTSIAFVASVTPSVHRIPFLVGIYNLPSDTDYFDEELITMYRSY